MSVNTDPQPAAQLPPASPLPSPTIGSLTRVRNAAIELVNAVDAHMQEIGQIEEAVSSLTSDPKGE